MIYLHFLHLYMLDLHILQGFGVIGVCGFDGFAAIPGEDILAADDDGSAVLTLPDDIGVIVDALDAFLELAVFTSVLSLYHPRR